MKKIIYIFSFLIMVFGLFACNQEEPTPIVETKYYISFETGDESISYDDIEWSDEVTLPTPEKEGYIFCGWFSDSEKKQTFDVSSVKTNATIYAKWEEIILLVTITNNVNQEKIEEFNINYGETFELDEYRYIEQGVIAKNINTNTTNEGINISCDLETVNNLILINKEDSKYVMKVINASIVGFYFEIKVDELDFTVETTKKFSYSIDEAKKIVKFIYSSDKNSSQTISIGSLIGDIDVSEIINIYGYYLDDEKVILDATIKGYIIKGE